MGIKTKVKASVTLAMAFLLLPGVSHALALKQKALVGLKGVYVLVEDFTPEAMRLGLNKDQIKTDVELRLRKAGLKVLTEKEQLGTPGTPFLYVNVTTSILPDPPFCAYYARIELQESVTLARGLQTFGSIWSAGDIRVVGTERIRLIREDVGDQVDKFINDFLAANPR